MEATCIHPTETPALNHLWTRHHWERCRPGRPSALRGARREAPPGGGNAGRAWDGGRLGSLFPRCPDPGEAAPGVGKRPRHAGRLRVRGCRGTAPSSHTGGATPRAPLDRVSASPRRAPRGNAGRAAACVCTGEGLPLEGARRSP